MNRTTGRDELRLGGVARANLLPPVVKARQRSAVLRRRLAAAVVGVVVLVGAGVATAFVQAAEAQSDLAAAQQHTTDLLAKQAKYVEVKQLQSVLDLSIAARQFGASTEVDWKAYLGSIRAVLPSDVTIDTVAVTSASPLIPFDQPQAPLQAPRVATLTLKLTSPGLPTIPRWLKGLRSLPGYADGTPGSIARVSGSGAYEVDLVLHINEGAYSNRFASPTSAEETQP